MISAFAPSSSATRVAPPPPASAPDPRYATNVVLPPSPLQQASLFLQQTQDLLNAKAHVDAVAEQLALTEAIAKLQPAWSPLPLGPYPPATDNSGFPKTGDPRLIVSASQITADQLKEPTLYAQGLVNQAAARRPALSGMFWLGLACLGVGIYVYKKR